MPYQRQNPNQCEIYTNQIKSLLTTYQPTAVEGKIADETNTIPILQRLFEAQRVQEYVHQFQLVFFVEIVFFCSI